MAILHRSMSPTRRARLFACAGAAALAVTAFVAAAGPASADTVVGAPVPVGVSPVGVAITPDGGHAYVTNQGSNSVPVIETEQSATLTGLPAAGVVGQPYRHAFTVTGRPAPTVAVTAGALPDGLTLSAEGVLSGTPTTSGRFELTVTATNGIGDAAVLPVVLDITDTTPPAGPFGSLGSDSLNWTF
ncbi:putative Ig domain-containing protein [Rhodococcus sp. 1.20]|jgi:YVTN family beta-propeller protein|uniref:putative Ig domain-containing protein n=1 Tax=Rhodococcus TaxID=1827 RepID=UPI00067F5E72|nr:MULTISPECIES: putative Ig domain-containing protein [Rhodococcus]MCC4302014.1 putative Ig domain-containing protein [Rhodococcus sp. 3-2]MDI9946592.1 putative Ig domain-containing protein [Rhodococcus sp. IEGM 1302]OMQ30291.1 hypothetical protein BK799_23695 [Rhodococcus sp. D-1]WOI89227.1 putative Ig domain-containing protein [Rhodococcus qingshengii]